MKRFLALALLSALVPVAATAQDWRPEPGAAFDYRLREPPKRVVDGIAVVVMDAFDTPASRVAAFREAGIKTICYVNAGSWEDWRPDAAAFPRRVLGKDYEGWPGERWLDIRRIVALAPILEARLDLCRKKGFDGVDPDNVDGWQNDTGFPITRTQQIRFNRWLAEQAHARGLAVGLKNAPALYGALADVFDFAVTESCFVQGWCRRTAAFADQGKAIFAIEYVEEGVDAGKFCAAAGRRGLSGLIKRRGLGAWRQNC